MQNIHVMAVGPIATNCWIYPLEGQPGRCAVIDPGDEGDRIIAFLAEIQLVPALIVLTHGHFDHINAVPALAQAYRSAGCEIAIHGADAAYLGPDSPAVHSRSYRAVGGNPSMYMEHWKTLPPPDRTLAEGDSVGPFTVLHLPGHTAGSIGLWDKAAGVLFSGDTLFCDGYGRTDLPGGSEQQLFASLRRLFAMDGGIQVCPGHGPATTIRREADMLG
jgi:glyoxylase-like metal-dependent hydrolase (beta-lactamase superfamily II)